MGIGEGYVNTEMDKLGTDLLDGRTPASSDVTVLPQFPLLPELKKTIQSNLPFVEVMRNEFAMPAGSRRNVRIHLPGDIYDPADVPAIVANTQGLAPIPDN